VSAWLIIAVAGGIAAADTTALFQGMLFQPLVVGTLLGAALGLPLEGALLGGLLQLLWISDLPIGGASFPDIGPASAGVIGGVLLVGVPEPVSLGQAGLAAVICALPLAWLAGRTVIWQRRYQRGMAPRALAAVRAHRPGYLRWLLVEGITLSFVRGALFAFTAALLTGRLLPLLWSPTRLPDPNYWLLLTVLAGAGAAQAAGLLDLRTAWPWLVAGLLLGILGVWWL
jgi:mannose/fructose/N-acetylgalactosamine-specific phosphotransferase system component IIC